MSTTLIRRYWAAQDPYDAEALARSRHPSWSADWPQSAERVPSHEADVAIHSSYPGYPAHLLDRYAGSDEAWKALPTMPLFTPVRLTGASDFWVGEARLDYPDADVWDAVFVVELRDDLVAHETAWFARTGDEGPWPATFVDRTPVPLLPITASMEHDASDEEHHEATHRAFMQLVATDPEQAAELLFHRSAVVDRPQLGQRASGLDGIARSLRDQRSVLPGTIRRVATSGDVLLSESRLEHAGASWFLVAILEFDGAKVRCATEYLAESFEPPAWRAAWVERA